MFRLRGKAGVEAEQSLNYLSEIVSNTDKVHVWRRNKKGVIVLVNILFVKVGEKECLQ